MRTNDFNHPVFAYILDCIEVEDNENATPEEKMQYVAERLRSECFPLHKRAFPNYFNIQNAIADWLQGLALPVAFYNAEILELAKQWGSIPENATERQEQRILDNYWSFMAMKLLQLLKRYKIELDVI